MGRLIGMMATRLDRGRARRMRSSIAVRTSDRLPMRSELKGRECWRTAVVEDETTAQTLAVLWAAVSRIFSTEWQGHP